MMPLAAGRMNCTPVLEQSINQVKSDKLAQLDWE